MPVIRISEDTWEHLKQWAEPLEDTPDDVIRRILEVAEEHKKRGKTVEKTNQSKVLPVVTHKTVKGLRTPERQFRRPILESIKELGGRASVSDVLEIVETQTEEID